MRLQWTSVQAHEPFMYITRNKDITGANGPMMTVLLVVALHVLNFTVLPVISIH